MDSNTSNPLSEEILHLLLNDESAATFEKGYLKFCTLFLPTVREDLCGAMAIFLENFDLLPRTPSRLFSMYLIYKTFERKSLAENPYAYIFARAAKSSSEPQPQTPFVFTPAEKYLAILILNSQTSKASGSSVFVAVFFESKLSPSEFFAEYIELHSLKDLQDQSFETTQTQSIHYIPECIPRIIPQPSIGASSTKENDHVIPKSVFPDVFDNEVVWMNPSEFEYDVQYDTMFPADPSPQELVDMAVRVPLQAVQFDALRMALQKDKSLATKLELAPENLSGIVARNPHAATMILALKLKQQQPHTMTPYYSEIVKMDMNLNSMEVVNGLTSCGLPDEFLHMFISNCIRTCEKNKSGQLSYLRRLVRLVCVFIQSLIRNQIIDIATCSDDLIMEIKCFCIEFSSYKEASGLYRLIRVLDDEKAEQKSLGKNTSLSNGASKPKPHSNSQSQQPQQQERTNSGNQTKATQNQLPHADEKITQHEQESQKVSSDGSTSNNGNSIMKQSSQNASATKRPTQNKGNTSP
eukprot:gene6541-9384_t